MSLSDLFRLINVFPIVDYHYTDLRKDSPRLAVDLGVLVGLPLLASLLGIVVPVNSGFIELLIPVLAILFGFTFNSLIIMAQYPGGEKIERKAIRHTRANTLYAVLVGLVTLIVFGFLSLLFPDLSNVSTAVLIGVSIVVFFLLFHYIATLMMVLRRMYFLIEGGAFETSE